MGIYGSLCAYRRAYGSIWKLMGVWIMNQFEPFLRFSPIRIRIHMVS